MTDREEVHELFTSGFTPDTLLICHPDGLLYSNQAGGGACLHPQARGVAIPFDIDDSLKNDCCCYYAPSLDEDEVARFQDRVPWPIIPEGSYEAWIRVQLAPGVEGILIWDNCD